MTSRSLLALAPLAASLAAAACATLPPGGVPATGEPLGYRAETQHYAYTVQEKVGEVRYQDAAGRAAGSAGVYENRTVTGSVTQWRPMQGSSFIDDEDFFRIAGDIEAARAVHDYRVGGVLLNRLGFSLLAVGVAGVGAIRAARLDTDDRTTRTLGGVSVLAIIMGGLWAYAGHARMRADDHLFDLDRARADAERYNAARKAAAPAAGGR